MYFRGRTEEQNRKKRSTDKCLIQAKNSTPYGRTLTAVLDRLDVYLFDYQYVFKTKTKHFFDKAVAYVKGNIQSPFCNIERICEGIDYNYHNMQHFITNSNWDYRQVIDQVAKTVSQTLPKLKLRGLIIDESGWLKKGSHSVGVGHQYCGNVGKLGNSQVAVFACLSNGVDVSMIDARLYLPEDWCQDSERCQEAGIPEKERRFRTKLDLAMEIVQHQIKSGVEFDYVGGDGFYGNDPHLARSIDRLGCTYMLDIHSDQKIYLDEPEIRIPKRTSSKGPEPKNLKASTRSTEANRYIQTLSQEDWCKIDIRDSAKGVLKGMFHFAKVFIWDKNVDYAEPRMLVIRKTVLEDGTLEIKYSFTNADLARFSKQDLAYMQAQRYFVEHAIKEAKYILGLNEYQTRKWLSWHHQVALNFLVSSFMLKEKLLNRNELPLLSARDIQEMLFFKLFKPPTEDQILERMQIRHQKRQSDIDNAYRRQLIC